MEELNVVASKPENQLQRLVSIIVSPGKTFESIMKKPNFALPLILTLAIGALVTLLTKDLAAELINLSYANAGLTPEQITQTKAMTEGYMQVLMYVGILVMPLTSLFKGMISHFISLMMGGEGKLSESVSVVVNAYVIQLLGMLLSLPIILMTKNAAFTFSAAVLLPMTKYGTPIYTTASAISVFTIWYLALSVMGFKKVHNYSTGKAMIAILIPFLLMIGFTWIGVFAGGPSGL